MVGTRHILGLAIDDSGVIASELCVRSGRAEVQRTGEILWEQELTADNTRQMGQRLRQFLHDQGFSSRRAVVGMAAKWVLTKEIDAPPASPDALPGLLSIQAERAFSLNAGELIFDYCGKISSSEKSQILLLAARRQTVNQIKELAEAAGLQLQSMTVSALACSKTLSEGGPAYRYGLYTRPTYCEFWGHMDGSLRFIRHVPLHKNGTPEGYADQLTSTIQRLMLLASGPGQSPPHHVTAYDACGLPDGLIEGLNGRLGPQIAVSDARVSLQSQGLSLPNRPQETGAIAAAAVAMTAIGAERPVIDFLHPRVGVKKTTDRKRVLIWAGSIAAVCLIGLGIVVAGWHADRKAIAACTKQLEDMREEIAAAQEVVDRTTYARSWGSQDPRFLNCLKELTGAFPEEGYIWVTSLALNEQIDERGAAKNQAGSGSLIGKTTNEASFYEMLDKIKENKMFSEVTMLHLRIAGRDSREKEFAINFKFRGVK